MLADKSAAPLPHLSWQPPPVTKCGDCSFKENSWAHWYFCENLLTCPMYQQQKASLDADKEVK